jgi:hypothetical protein
MEIANGEDAFVLWSWTWVLESCPSNFVLVSAPCHIAKCVRRMSWLEVSHSPFTLTNNHSGCGFIAYKYARIDGVPVLLDDRVLVGYGDPFGSD